MRQLSGQRHNFFPSRFASNLLLLAYTCILGMILVVNSLQLKNNLDLCLNEQAV